MPPTRGGARRRRCGRPVLGRTSLTKTTEIGTAIRPLRSVALPARADGSPSAQRHGVRPRVPSPPDPAPSACPSRIRCQAATGICTKVPAVGDPTDIVQFGAGHHVAAGEGRRRVALQRRVAAYLVVVGLEVGKFPFKITGIPEQHMVDTFSPRRSDQALHEWVGTWAHEFETDRYTSADRGTRLGAAAPHGRVEDSALQAKGHVRDVKLAR